MKFHKIKLLFVGVIIIAKATFCQPLAKNDTLNSMLMFFTKDTQTSFTPVAHKPERSVSDNDTVKVIDQKTVIRDNSNHEITKKSSTKRDEKDYSKGPLYIVTGGLLSTFGIYYFTHDNKELGNYARNNNVNMLEFSFVAAVSIPAGVILAYTGINEIFK